MAQGKPKEKSILDKFTDTMKGLADSASQALKSEEPARVDETAAAYMPFAAEGMVSDLPPVPPVPPIATPPTRRKRASSEKGKRRAAKRTPKTAASKPARKATAKSARTRTKAAGRKTARKTSRKTVKRTGAKKAAARKRGR